MFKGKGKGRVGARERAIALYLDQKSAQKKGPFRALFLINLLALLLASDQLSF